MGKEHMGTGKVHIFMFIDALGWEIVNEYGFLNDLLPHRYPVKMQFGYSSTAIPTILTGQPPEVHKHLSFYYYAPEKSPFKIFRWMMLQYLPPRIFNRWRVRHILSKIIARVYGFTGYFEMYSMPYDRLPYFDYIEKNDIFVPGGLAPVENLADVLTRKRIPYHISDWRLSEPENIDQLLEKLKQGDIKFAFLYTAALDGLLHMKLKDKAAVRKKLEWYSGQIKTLFETAASNYKDFSISIMSDHGMTALAGTLDIKKQVEALGFKFGLDYVAVYDSTMARMWFFNDKAREQISNLLSESKDGHILSHEEKIKYGINFPDDMYGQMIFLLNPGWQIEPCDMGLKALPGMHGFAPEDKHSFASFISSAPVENPPEWVGDYFKNMKSRIDEVCP